MSFVICHFAISNIAFADDFLNSAVKDGIGIRPMGMGGAFVALANDSDSVYYNPASLTDSKTNYTRGYMDMNTDHYTLNDCWAFSMNGAGMAAWDRVDKSGNSAGVTAFSIGYKGSNNASWGMTYKNISWNTSASGNDRGWTMDGGLKIPVSKDLTAGLLLQDVAKNTAPLATSVRLGFALIPSFLKDTNLAADGEFRDLKSPKGATVLMHYGAETKITENIILRGGWTMDHFTAGASVMVSNCTLEYAVIINQYTANTFMFGIRLGE